MPITQSIDWQTTDISCDHQTIKQQTLVMHLPNQPHRLCTYLINHTSCVIPRSNHTQRVDHKSARTKLYTFQANITTIQHSKHYTKSSSTSPAYQIKPPTHSNCAKSNRPTQPGQLCLWPMTTQRKPETSSLYNMPCNQHNLLHSLLNKKQQSYSSEKSHHAHRLM